MALQNELIARGYITSLLTIPEQSLAQGTLKLELAYGKIGDIFWSTTSEQTTSIWNNIPTRTGDILRLTDLEQGMETCAACREVRRICKYYRDNGRQKAICS